MTVDCGSPIDGKCGSAHGEVRAMIPQQPLEFCSVGSPANLSGTSIRSWTCKGENGGKDDETCSATKVACGSATQTPVSAAPTANLCTDGSRPTATETTNGKRSWSCGAATCEVEKKITPTVVNGSCGSEVNLCSAGTLIDSDDTSTKHKWSCASQG